jgi:hypothetical protein
MNSLEKFYFDGCLLGKFKKGGCLTTYLSVLKSIFTREFKEGFHLENKYAHSCDLRPNVYEYDGSILDILFESNTPEFIKKALGYDLYLAHVQVRIADPFPIGQENRSYMEWHRDTYVYENKLVGNAPPTYKLIFYPEFNGVKEKPLMLAPGTHLSMLTNRTQDYQQLQHKNPIFAQTSTEEFLFFNTSVFHSTLPAHKNGTLRIIYNFCVKEQLQKYAEQTELHELYQQKLERSKND